MVAVLLIPIVVLVVPCLLALLERKVVAVPGALRASTAARPRQSARPSASAARGSESATS